MEQKTCCRCKKEYDNIKENFYFNKTLGKYHYHCKACHSKDTLKRQKDKHFKMYDEKRDRLIPDVVEDTGDPIRNLFSMVVDNALLSLTPKHITNRDTVRSKYLNNNAHNDYLSALDFFGNTSGESNLPTICEIMSWDMTCIQRFAHDIIAGIKKYEGFNFTMAGRTFQNNQGEF